MEMTKQLAEEFFSELFYGEHHIPSEVKQWGQGWYIFTHEEFSTFDYNNLTRLVFMAHEKCVRVAIRAHNTGRIKICIWQREREGDFSSRHPTIEQAIEKYKAVKEKLNT